MTDLLRQEIVSSTRTVVVKIGTRVLTRADGTLDEERITHLASQINEMLDMGRRVILVSSGAVGAGRARRSILPLAVSGNRSSVVKVSGTM